MTDQQHTLDDIYALVETLNISLVAIRDDVASLKTDVTQIRGDVQTLQVGMGVLAANVHELDAMMANVEPRVESCELRIATLESNIDDHIRDNPHATPEEFPVDTTLVCTGLRESSGENPAAVAQDLINDGLGLINVEVVRARRLASRYGKPGLFKIQLPTVTDKIAALRVKRNLMDSGYRGVFIRSSTTHTDRILHQNFMAILKELPNGDNYRVTSNGKLVTRDETREMGPWSRGAPVGLSQGLPRRVGHAVTDV